MSGFVFGDVQAYVENPWAYDATNDLPKSHGLYVAAAGLLSYLTLDVNPLAATTAHNSTTDSVSYTVPAGKNAYITDLLITALAGGPVRFDVQVGGTSLNIPIATPSGGGSAVWRPTIPRKVAAGGVISFMLFNAAAVSASEVTAYVGFVVL